MLIHGQRIGELARGVMPSGDGTRDDDYPARVVRAVAGYVRGQLLFSLAMGVGAGIGLYIFGVAGIFPEGKTYALAFGVFFGLMELIPYVGPFLGARRRCSSRSSPTRSRRCGSALLFVGLQQIEGHIVAPLVFGHALRINPLLVIFALLFGGELFGVLGALRGPARGRGAARDGRLPAPAHGPRALGHDEPARVGRRRAAAPRARSAARRAAEDDAYCARCGAPRARAEVPSRV